MICFFSFPTQHCEILCLLKCKTVNINCSWKVFLQVLFPTRGKKKVELFSSLDCVPTPEASIFDAIQAPPSSSSSSRNLSLSVYPHPYPLLVNLLLFHLSFCPLSTGTAWWCWAIPASAKRRSCRSSWRPSTCTHTTPVLVRANKLLRYGIDPPLVHTHDNVRLVDFRVN